MYPFASKAWFVSPRRRHCLLCLTRRHFFLKILLLFESLFACPLGNDVIRFRKSNSCRLPKNPIPSLMFIAFDLIAFTTLIFKFLSSYALIRLYFLLHKMINFWMTVLMRLFDRHLELSLDSLSIKSKLKFFRFRPIIDERANKTPHSRIKYLSSHALMVTFALLFEFIFLPFIVVVISKFNRSLLIFFEHILICLGS